ncbi:MAG: hypothetical protein ACI4JB_07335 [Porcipelethomonas sp.]
MKKGKNLGLSIFMLVLTIVLIALVVFTVGVNYVFGSSIRSGSVFGKNVFVMNSKVMEPEISEGSAVIADSNEIAVLTEGNVILFAEEQGFENVMRIVEVVHNTDSTVYRVAGDNEQDNILNVPKENVVAKCTKESKRLGGVITFMKSMAGIIIGMIIPCIILLVMLILKIVSIRRRQREEDDIVYPETFGIGSNTEERDYSANPLFDPSMAPKPDASFELKKSSIAQNFAMKPTAKKKPSGPSGRNIQTENAVEKFRAAVDDKPSGPVSRRPSLAPDIPVSDRTEKMAAIKAALHNQGEDPASEETQFPTENTAASSVSENTQNISNAEFKAATEQPASYEPKPAAAPKPKKQDNIKSIDDLIKALEEEKKKL